MNVLHADKQTFAALTAQKDKVVLLDFFATWCGPCRMIAPVIEELSDEMADVVFAKIDVDELPELAQQYGIVSIPTLVLLKDGKEIDRAVGARPKDAIAAMIASAK